MRIVMSYRDRRRQFLSGGCYYARLNPWLVAPLRFSLPFSGVKA